MSDDNTVSMSSLLDRLEKLATTITNDNKNSKEDISNKIDVIDGKSLYGDYNSKLQYSTFVEKPEENFKNQELISRELVSQEIETTMKALKTSTWVTDRVAANLLKEAIHLIRIHGGNIGDSPVSSSLCTPSVNSPEIGKNNNNESKITAKISEKNNVTRNIDPGLPISPEVRKPVPFTREATSTFMSREATVTLTTEGLDLDDTSLSISSTSTNTMSEVEADITSSWL